jgi:hypothetical protein
MRFVDLAKLRLPSGWTQRAQEATQAVRAGADPSDYAHVWRELKDRLAELLPDKKCWYCESSGERADNAVDHFRPKNRVADAAAPHSGYRWLAFEPSNYRYSCTFCNSRRVDVEHDTAGGKADRFPLLDEARRVYSERGSIKHEGPALLDPCSIRDWKLLGCRRENGEPCAASVDAEDIRRVEISMDVYHLHFEPTCVRRHAFAIRLIADVDHAKHLFSALVAGKGSRADFEAVGCRIARAIDRTAEFSGEMRFVLKGERHSDHPWIQDLLEV